MVHQRSIVLCLCFQSKELNNFLNRVNSKNSKLKYSYDEVVQNDDNRRLEPKAMMILSSLVKKVDEPRREEDLYFEINLNSSRGVCGASSLSDEDLDDGDVGACDGGFFCESLASPIAFVSPFRWPF